ncbi:MAG: S66 peptidase family protein [Bacteroidota bacterium]
MDKIKPPKLNKGDLIGIISPASCPDDVTRIEKGASYLEKLGYRVVIGENARKNYGYLAGEDNLRLDDLHNMFGNKEVKAIFCTRGGYGTPRLLDRVDYNLIKKNPKIFVGYSDITALQMAILRKTGLISFAGPMVAVDFWNEVNPYTEEMFWAMITSDKKYGRVNNPGNEKIDLLKGGQTEGEVIGGNLALLTSVIGTPYSPDFKDRVLLIEDIGEPPYRIDRMLNQLKLSGVFKSINGIILGCFTDCVEPDPYSKTLSLNEVIDGYLGGLDMPVMYNYKHGHVKENITVPYGITHFIDADKGIVEITESAVV